jgi:hypothetical protein
MIGYEDEICERITRVSAIGLSGLSPFWASSCFDPSLAYFIYGVFVKSSWLVEFALYTQALDYSIACLLLLQLMLSMELIY